MKKQLLLLALLLPALFAGAQTPSGSFAWQATLRSSNGGAVLANEEVAVRITLMQSSPTGPEVYQEEHTVRSNSQGIVQLAVGSGKRLSGYFNNIPWHYPDSIYIKAEIKRNGADYVSLAPQLLRALPYALYAHRADTALRVGSIAEVNRAQQVASAVTINGPMPMGGSPLFAVLNSMGDTVFAVYDNGIRAGVASTRSATGGFTVHSRDRQAQTTTPLMLVTPDSARLYIDEANARSPRGGFAVAGRLGRSAEQTYLLVRTDSTAIQFNPTDGSRSPRGGFAVAGRLGRAASTTSYLTVQPDCTRIYFDERLARSPRGGFAVAGRLGRAATTAPLLHVTSDSTHIYFNDDAQTRSPRGGFAVAGRLGRAGNASYMSLTPTLVELRSEGAGSNDILTNQLVNTFDVGAISQQVQDYTSYMTVNQQQTTATAMQAQEATAAGGKTEGYNPNIATDPNGNKYAIAKVGNYRWLKTNLRTSATDSINGSFYDNGYSYMGCPDGWHIATLEDWKFLRDYTIRTFDLKGATDVTPSLLNSRLSLYFPLTGYEDGSHPSEAAFAAQTNSMPYEIFISEKDGFVVGAEYQFPSEKLTVRCVEGKEGPQLDLTNITEVMAESALLTGKVISNGGMPLSDYGFIVTDLEATAPKPDTISTYSTGKFSHRLTGLQAGGAYNVRAYAVNHMDRYEEPNETRLHTKSYPDISLRPTTPNNQWTVILNTNSNPLETKSFGVCYSTTTQAPTIAGSYVTAPEGTTSPWEATIPTTPGCSTYVRAFAIFENGEVRYSETNGFETPALPQISITSSLIMDYGIQLDISTNILHSLQGYHHYVEINSKQMDIEIEKMQGDWTMAAITHELFSKPEDFDPTKDLPLTIRVGIAPKNTTSEPIITWSQAIQVTLEGAKPIMARSIAGTKTILFDGYISGNTISPEPMKIIEYSTSSDMSNAKLDTIVMEENYFSHTLIGLIPNTTYYVRYIQPWREKMDMPSQVYSITTKGISEVSHNGNTYRTAIIGQEEWMIDELKLPGDITQAQSPTELASSNSPLSIVLNGVTCYNRIAVTQANDLCPDGYQLPQDLTNLQQAISLNNKDEIELFAAGSYTDLSGVNQESHDLLNFMAKSILNEAALCLLWSGETENPTLLDIGSGTFDQEVGAIRCVRNIGDLPHHP
ncbi:MAG: hypothetical protein IJU72_09975 [Bacteroidales bacterium]|nr:hypothetical protein [Bacteroidales bacterium]